MNTAACKRKTYKWKAGDGTCLPCPKHSDSPEPGALECRCLDGYYRASGDDKAASCTSKLNVSIPETLMKKSDFNTKYRKTANITRIFFLKISIKVGGAYYT